ncbi:Hypothetical predicted protein [Paramuricea clavata]|uniref:Uncharacterized protein n=1 Tax=Paramuricea clavata TaxID=317549 RepID=A0A7D9I3W3_PARCT|nr:Hypothetical predicted protein [Paramuricea clavata]
MQLDPQAVPVTQAPRKIPAMLRGKLKQELNRMEKEQVIVKVDKPTDRLHNPVIVEKPNGKRINHLFEDLEGVETDIDDILVSGKTIEEHDQRLQVTLVRTKMIGITLNPDKCKFRVAEVTYLGHKLTGEGVQPDQTKIVAINDMPAPQDKLGAQRLLGMVPQVKVLVQYSTISKLLKIADTLSRAQLAETAEIISEQDMKSQVHLLYANLPCSSEIFEEVRQETARHPVSQKIIRMIRVVWPQSKKALPEDLKEYWNQKLELSETQGIILKDQRILIPIVLRRKIVDKLHQGHQGIEKTKQRARQSVYWPRINKDIEDLVSKCSHCEELRNANP